MLLKLQTSKKPVSFGCLYSNSCNCSSTFYTYIFKAKFGKIIHFFQKNVTLNVNVIIACVLFVCSTNIAKYVSLSLKLNGGSPDIYIVRVSGG